MENLIIRFETHQANDGSGVCWHTAIADAGSTIDVDFDMNPFEANGDSPLEAAYNLLNKLCQAETEAYNQYYSQQPIKGAEQ